MFPSFEGFKAWVANQPCDSTFNYFDNSNCAFAQYLKSLGMTRVGVDGFDYGYLDQAGNPHHEKLDSLHPRLGHILACAVSGRFFTLHSLLINE